jgi:hypothetical protein
MRSLNEFLEDAYVRRIIDQSRESRAVQGILIEIDPYWLYCWRLGESINPPDPIRGFKEGLLDGLFFPDYRYANFVGNTQFLKPWMPFRQISGKELHWQPPVWNQEMWERSYSRWPVVMRICMYPDAPKHEKKQSFNLPIFRGEGFRVHYEVRPIMKLYLGPKALHRPLLGGISVGVSNTDVGTLGGILKSQKDEYYGLTCAHVVGANKNGEQPAQVDKHAAIIGSVVQQTLPPPFPSHAKKIAADQSKYSAKIDAALIKLDHATSAKLEVLKMGPVTSIEAFDNIAQDEKLQLTGRTSDWQVVQKSTVAPFYNVTNPVTREEYCYKKPLIFREPNGRQACRPGDSGAWICKEVGVDYHWIGMVVGGDQQLGLAIGAEEIKSWWQAAGFDLSSC